MDTVPSATHARGRGSNVYQFRVGEGQGRWCSRAAEIYMPGKPKARHVCSRAQPNAECARTYRALLNLVRAYLHDRRECRETWSLVHWHHFSVTIMSTDRPCTPIILFETSSDHKFRTTK
eukprot:scaffold187023_cov31-Tisochrysis_lutea.AAC.2